MSNPKRVVFQCSAVLGLFSLTVLVLYQNYSSPFEAPEPTKNPNHTSSLQEVLDLQRKIIREDMKDYEYPKGTYGVSARRIEDLLIKESGKPIRSIIITEWRSGSTFFSNTIKEHPATFFHLEPLLDFGIVQIRGPPLASDALKRVRALFNCEYGNLDKYIEYVKADPWPLRDNEHLWKQCEIHGDLCYRPEFSSEMCKLFPFQLMKLTRLRLNIAQELLADDELAVRMVLLVRDPRGTLQSRKHRRWCPPSRDCSDPGLLCADLVSDYKIAVELVKKYPNRFKVIRYEDLAVEPDQRVKEVCEFYGLDYHENIKKFLDTHTKYDKGGVCSTFRNSSTAPFRWRTELGFEEVEEIQETCALAMKYWGYLPAMNATHLKEFHPVTDYVL